MSENRPAYWGDKAHIGEVQSNLGLDELFGCKENYVEFTPNILDYTEMTVKVTFTWGDGCGQFYEELMAFGGRKPRFTVSDKRIRARLHRGDGGDCLWIANARKGVDIPVIIEAGKRGMKTVLSLKDPAGELRDGKIHLAVSARDVAV